MCQPITRRSSGHSSSPATRASLSPPFVISLYNLVLDIQRISGMKNMFRKCQKKYIPNYNHRLEFVKGTRNFFLVGDEKPPGNVSGKPCSPAVHGLPHHKNQCGILHWQIICSPPTAPEGWRYLTYGSENRQTSVKPRIIPASSLGQAYWRIRAWCLPYCLCLSRTNFSICQHNQ